MKFGSQTSFNLLIFKRIELENMNSPELYPKGFIRTMIPKMDHFKILLFYSVPDIDLTQGKKTFLPRSSVPQVPVQMR